MHKRFMRRIIFPLVAVLMFSCGSLVYSDAGEVAIASGTCGEELTWELSGDGVLIISGKGEMTNFNSTLQKAPWYSQRFDINSVIIKDGASSIGDLAFANCTNLVSINIPSSVTSFGMSAFNGCYSLISMEIPEDLISIGNYAFCGCINLESITIPNGITSINEGTFCGCDALTRITIPSGVTSIGNYAFSGCDTLTTIDIPNSVTEIGNGAFNQCISLENITIPRWVTCIRDSVFSSCLNLEEIVIPNNVVSIGSFAFDSCSTLSSVKLPNGINSIKKYAFANCQNLASITVPDSVAVIENDAFQGCSSLTSIKLPAGLTKINYQTFLGCCNLTSITIPNSVTEIGFNAFADCYNLTSVTIPESVTLIGESAFYKVTLVHCLNTSLSLSDSEAGDVHYNYSANCCAICGNYHEHSYEQEITKATLEQDGQIMSVCRLCGDKIFVAVIPHLGDIELEKTEFEYTGEQIIPKVVVTDRYGQVLSEDQYSLVFSSDCKSVGIHKFSIVFDGNYKGEIELSYEITEYKHSWDSGQVVTQNTCIQNGMKTYECQVCDAVKSEVIQATGHSGGRATCTTKAVCSVCGESYGGLKAHTIVADKAVAATCTKAGLTEGSHCSVCNTVIKAQETVKATGHKEVAIAGKAATCTETGLTAGKKCKTCGTVTVKQTTIKATGHNYSTTYTVDKAASMTKTGTKSQHCKNCDAKKNVKTIYKLKTVKLKTTEFVYNGKAKNPTVVVKDGKGNTIDSKNYTVTKAKGRTNVGKYTYKITFKNEYKGVKAKTLTFKINPKATSVKSLTKAKKAFTVKLNKISKQATGYEVMYSTSKNFTKKTSKTVTIKSYKTTSKKITGLKAKKTYYVKVRTYKTVNGVKYYSGWSKAKKVTTK